MYKIKYIMYTNNFKTMGTTVKTMNSTEARQSFSHLISLAKKEPVTIRKKNRDEAVVLSTSRYQELKKFEDILYGKAAQLAVKEGVISKEDTENLLNNID